jgi:uncharacterized protein (DUF2126 family)
VHFGQGKWYPGEQLPRWSLNCFWRATASRCGAIRAVRRRAGRLRRRCRRNGCDFSAAVAERLGLSGEHMFPAYEDWLYYLWRERKLPVNVTLSMRG